MRKTESLLVGLTLIAGLGIGCGPDRPRDYARDRPAVDQLDDRDRGLQSKDVVTASDQMAQSLLALPELNVSDKRWTVVVTGVRNETATARQNLDIFIQRLRVNLARHGRDRVQLIANRDSFRELQSRELEQERDDFQQGSGRSKPGPAGVQPDFGLEATATDLPNRGTNYYLFEFRLVDMNTREMVWTDAYEVRVAN
jgi:Peptidoglycan-synthase activator LpoB